MNKFLNLKENNGYYYAERLGVDSVAFILYDGDSEKIGLINEFKPPIDRFLLTAFGGSLDKDISLEEIVKEEVREEAGYINAEIRHLGKMFVSTQMNQFCHLYVVDVTNALFSGRYPQTEMEAQAEVKWVDFEEIDEIECWKTLTIIYKIFMGERND